MFSILAEGIDGNDYDQISTQDHFTEYSSLGLHTLVLATRDLTNAEQPELESGDKNVRMLAHL